MSETERPKLRLRPFGGVSLLAAGGMGTLVLWYASFPSMYYLTWIVAVGALWVVTIAVPLLRCVSMAGWAALRGRDLVIDGRGWGLLLGWTLLVMTSVGLELPLRAQFAMAQGQLEEQLAARGTDQHVSRWAGVYYVDEIAPGRCAPSRTRLIIQNDTESAFVHAPGGIEGLCYNSGSTGHLWGDWYWVTED